MAKKLRSEDIIEKGLFKEEIENTKKLLKIVMALKDEFKELGESVKKSVAETSKIKGSEEVKKYTEETEKLNKATEDLTALEKEEIKLKKKLVDLNEEQAKENAKLRVRIQEKNKELKEEAKINLGLESTYQKQSKRLNELRKKYKNLVLEQGKNVKGAKELRQEIEELDKTLKDVDAEVGQFQRSVGNYEKINQGAKNSFASLSGFLLGIVVGSFEKSRASGRAFQLRLDQLKNSVNALFVAFDKVFSEGGITFFNFFDKVGEAFRMFADNIDKSNESVEKYFKLQDLYIDQISQLQIEISKLVGEEEKLQIMADDNTRSMSERADILDLMIAKQEERLQKEEEIAQKEFDLAKESLKNDFIKAGELERFNKLEEAGALKSLKFLKDRQLSDSISLENLEKFKSAVIGLQELENERIANDVENEKLRTEIKQDQIEQDLDFLIDGFDNQKTINERKLQDERKFLEERQKILQETIEKGNQSFEKQKEKVQELTEVAIDFDELMGLDADQLAESVKQLGLSEVILKRVLDIIRERKIVNQDNAESQQDLNDALDEQFLKERELKALKEGKTGEALENKIIKAQIDLLKKQIEERKLAGEETIDQEIELARLQIDIEKRKQEEIRELVQQTTAFIEEEFGRRTDLIIEDIDRQIEASKNRESQLIDSANAGNRLADESVALERERQAQLEADRKKALQRQQRIELILASINAYSNRSRSGDENALLNTISDITTLLTFASNVQAFEKGGLVEGGEQLVRINEKGQEFVLRHDVVQKVGVDKLNRLNQGDINALNDRSGDLAATEYMIKQAMKGVASEVANAVKQIPVQNWNMSEITGGLKESIQEGKKIVNKHYKKQKRLS